jgi:hypothetical protein
VSQPSKQGARLEAPGEIDSKLGEFWVENPWEIVKQGHNLSSYERDRAYLNVGGRDFAEISFLTGADNEGDGRCAVAADFRNDGRLDLVVRQVGGGSLLLYENAFPTKHYLEVSLRGTQSNRLGIGARLVAHIGDRSISRELYPTNSYRSQAPCIVHFGLGDAKQVDSLSIRWPSGTEQVISNLPSDRHVIITEGKSGSDAVETIVPGRTIAP